MFQPSATALRLIALALVLHVLHLPLPCYDADGENRGHITHGIFDPAAWHVVFLGILPEHDIDRGPLNSDSQHWNLSGSAFDAPFIVGARIAAPDATSSVFLRLSDAPGNGQFATASLSVATEPDVCHNFSGSYSIRAPQAWRRHLCVMLI